MTAKADMLAGELEVGGVGLMKELVPVGVLPHINSSAHMHPVVTIRPFAMVMRQCTPALARTRPEAFTPHVQG